MSRGHRPRGSSRLLAAPSRPPKAVNGLSRRSFPVTAAGPLRIHTGIPCPIRTHGSPTGDTISINGRGVNEKVLQVNGWRRAAGRLERALSLVSMLESGECRPAPDRTAAPCSARLRGSTQGHSGALLNLESCTARNWAGRQAVQNMVMCPDREYRFQAVHACVRRLPAW